VVAADVLDLRLPHRPFRVVASPPYNVSSALLRLLLAPGSQLIAADLVVQRAFARRFADDWLHNGGRAQRRWNIRCGAPIPRSAFCPPPRVDSATLLVRRR
jgi:23S rRNA (adenine-N6)-dimethyltransferase